MERDVIVCRCEDVTAGELEAALAAGAASAAEVKHVTRAGMGVCGGRTCRPLLERLLERPAVGGATAFTQRIPVRPLTVAELAQTPLADGSRPGREDGTESEEAR